MGKATTEEGMRRQRENRARLKRMRAIARLPPRRITDDDAEKAKAEWMARQGEGGGRGGGGGPRA